ncbi:MAG TPA: ABC transporter ATP-binding protein [Tepidisphaeraceae bacterium]|nr:ABC transporter ATP-binding protein [Tepidisphaeraceae bacterium]
MLLSVSNLTVCYGVITALHDVSVEIAPGEIVALIGANGAGKTTLLRTISGLLKPASGGVSWCPPTSKGQGSERVLDYEGTHTELVGMRADQIVRLGISHVPEGRQIFADLTVRDNLMLGAFTLRGRSEIEEGLERCFGMFPVLNERKNQRGGTLSGGEQQMLAIARALMGRPRLLLLDEPSLGLAPLIVRQIFQIIREINQRGATILLVEQNAHMALTVANRGYVIQSGRVILSDSAAKLLENPEVKRAYLGG